MNDSKGWKVCFQPLETAAGLSKRFGFSAEIDLRRGCVVLVFVKPNGVKPKGIKPKGTT